MDRIWEKIMIGMLQLTFGDKDAKRTFTLSTDNMKAPTYITLTDESDPTNVIKLMKNYISMPFNN